MIRRLVRTKLAAVLGAALLAAGPAWAEAPLTLELNKLEPLPAGALGCRAYFIAKNPDAAPVEQLRIDLVLFGKDDVVARRIAMDLGPLLPNKTVVRLVDLQALPCDGIGRLLLNDVLVCRAGAPAADRELPACLERLTVSSRTPTGFEK